MTAPYAPACWLCVRMLASCADHGTTCACVFSVGGGGQQNEKQQEAEARRDMILGSVLTPEAKERCQRRREQGREEGRGIRLARSR